MGHPSNEPLNCRRVSFYHGPINNNHALISPQIDPMPVPNESQLAAAIAHRVAHPTASIRTVATLFGVSRSTLARRLQDGLPSAIAHAHEQLLSLKQEDLLAEWILQLEKHGYAPGPRII